jgi:hypothetical protein
MAGPGGSATPEILNLRPEVIQGIRDQFRGYKTANADEGKTYLANIAQLKNGTLNIQDLDPKQAKDIIRSAPHILSTNADLITKGDKTPSVFTSWAHTYGQMLNAVTTLDPATTDTKSLKTAVDIIATPQTRNTIRALIANPQTAEQGRELAIGSRGFCC